MSVHSFVSTKSSCPQNWFLVKTSMGAKTRVITYRTTQFHILYLYEHTQQNTKPRVFPLGGVMFSFQDGASHWATKTQKRYADGCAMISSTGTLIKPYIGPNISKIIVLLSAGGYWASWKEVYLEIVREGQLPRDGNTFISVMQERSRWDERSDEVQSRTITRS